MPTKYMQIYAIC